MSTTTIETSTTSLTGKVLGSLGWIFTNILAKNFIQFARTSLLWYVLTPKEFGLNGMAWLPINGFNLLQDMGFANALIQRKTDLADAISVTWYANVVIRLVLYAAIYAVAPLVADQFHEPEVLWIVRVAAISIVLGSFGSANEALLRKTFQFKRLLVVDTVELVTQCVLQVVLAWLGFGVWSLVYGVIVATIARSVALWWLAPIHVGRFKLSVAKDMFHFGKHMTGSSLLLWLIGNMDYYFVGRYLGPAALGFYTLAYKLSHMIATNVARMLGSVLFPAFSEIGHDLERVRGAWLRAVRYSLILIMPMGLGVIVFSREIITSFFPPQCEVAILPTAILSLFALCRGLGVPLGDLAKGIGKPGILTRVALFHVVIMAPSLWLSASSGSIEEFEPAIIAVSVAVAGTGFLAIAFSLYLTAREVRFTLAQVLEVLKPSLTAGSAMAAAGWLGKAAMGRFAAGVPPLVTLIALGAMATGVYVATIGFLFPAVAADLRRMLVQRRGKRV